MALTKINANVIANNTIAVGNIADNSVDATKIASNSILTRHIDDNQIGIDQLNVSDGSNGQMLTTNGSGTLSFSTPSSFDADAAQVFNESGAAVDFRVEGDTEQNLLFVDGSADKIGIGTASPVTKLNIQGGSASTYTGAGPSDILRVSQSTAGAWIASDFDGAFAYMGNDSSTTAKFAAYNYATSAEMNMILGQDRMYIKSDGKVGIGTQSPNRTLTVYGSSNGEMNLKNSSADFLIQQAGHNTSIGNSSGSGYIEVFTNNGSSPAIRMENGGDVRSNYATDAGSNKRYTATLNPRIAQVGLQGYWDPTKAADGTDFSPSTHGNGNQDLTLGSGVTHVTNSNRAVWQFDGTSNASMHGNPNLSASKSCSFSMWVYYNDVTSLSSGYQLNGIQIGNHYMYIGIVQGADDHASMYGYIGQGTNIVHGSSGANENAYINSDEWVYLTIQAGHGSSDVTSRLKGRAEVYLNGALVTRVNSIALPTVAANSSSSFYLGRVQAGYYLGGYIGPAVLYERTLHQWEILENMRVHADMYMS